MILACLYELRHITVRSANIYRSKRYQFKLVNFDDSPVFVESLDLSHIARWTAYHARNKKLFLQ